MADDNPTEAEAEVVPPEPEPEPEPEAEAQPEPEAQGAAYRKGYHGYVPSRDGDNPVDLTVAGVTGRKNAGA